VAMLQTASNQCSNHVVACIDSNAGGPPDDPPKDDPPKDDPPKDDPPKPSQCHAGIAHLGNQTAARQPLLSTRNTHK